MSRKHASLARDEDINSASWAAARGAVVGAAKWGIFSAVAAAVAFNFSPLYRSFTIQFKVFIQMSGMCIGSMIEADKRLRSHEMAVRNYRRIRRDEEIWRRYQEHDYSGKRSEDVDNTS